MIRRWIGRALFAAAALAAMVIAVANRQPAALSLDPLPFAIEAPLYLLLLAAVILGFLLGAFGAAMTRRRRARRAAQVPAVR